MSISGTYPAHSSRRSSVSAAACWSADTARISPVGRNTGGDDKAPESRAGCGPRRHNSRARVSLG